MAYNEIRKRIADLGAGHVLESLPSTDSVRWVHLPTATPPTALVLGSVKGRDILAYMLKFGDKPREVHYCSVPANRTNPTSSMQTLLQDDIVRLPLDVPFRYNAETSKNGKRRFSMVVKWYFLAKGLIEGPFGDYADYTKRFNFALRLIEQGQQADKKSGHERRSRRSQPDPAINEEIIEGEDETNVYRLRSGDRVNGRVVKESDSPPSTRRRMRTPRARSPSSEVDDEENRDLVKLQEYLDSHDVLHLLQNIPEADEVQFAEQDFMPNALPKKLFVGHTNEDRNDIYAFMRPSRNHHEINYFFEDSDGSHHAMNADQTVKQHIYHPFNKTFPTESTDVDQSDKARLSLVIKWYFLASGVAQNIVLRETKAFPERMRFALEYIARRMDCIQSTLSPARRRTTSAARPTSPLPSSPDAHRPATSSLKRTAEDAGFETLARIVSQDQDLTKQINDADEELENLDMRRQNFEEKLEAQRKQFMEKWDKQNQEALQRKHELSQKRTDVRKRFKRQSLNVAEL